ncbi:hypothetical protein C2W64_03630 [Brevibacillus laterosporus]|nr:hypothetical protein C2W64_03630 [Brevibacillus laterosporus]
MQLIVKPTVFPLVDYGQTLTKVLDFMCDWGGSHIEKRVKEGESIIITCL